MDGTGAAIKLHHEIEDFNQAAGVLLAWVNIPSLSSIEDTVLYVYYGNPNCVDQEYPEKTWDAFFYIGVYHMNSVFDSSGTGNGLTEQGGIINTPGRIGTCYQFDGTDDYLTKIFAPPSKITVEAWWNSDVIDNSVVRRIIVIRKDGTNANCNLQKMNQNNNNNIRFSGGAPDWELTVCPNTWITGSWYYTAATAQKNDQSKIYWNGILCSAKSITKKQ